MLGFHYSRRLLAILLAVGVLSSMSTVPGEHVTDEPISEFTLIFDQAQGLTYLNQIALTGTANQPLRNATWSVVNISGVTPTTLATGPYLTSVVPVDDGHYAWSLVVDLDGVDCTCYVQVDIEDVEHTDRSYRHVLYVGNEHQAPVLTNTDGVFDSLELYVRSQHLISDEFHMELNLIEADTNTSNGQLMGVLCEAPAGVCLDTAQPVNLDHEVTNGVLRVPLNASVLQVSEGIWQLDLRYIDALLKPSNTIRTSLIVDTNVPEVNLSVDTSVDEGSPLQIYADIEDGYAGARLSVTWAIVDENGFKRAPTPSETISDRHLVLEFSQAGSYVVELNVVDLAGNSAKETANFSVLNVRPTAKISVNGLEVSSDNVLRLDANAQWSISGNMSEDNEPVDFLWVIDDSVSIRSTPFLKSDDLPSSGQHRIELIVFDDNGATHSSVIEIDIIGESTGAAAATEDRFAFAAAFLLIVALLLLFAKRSSREGASLVLPRWKDSVGHDPIENTTRPDGLDATVEEEKPRG